MTKLRADSFAARLTPAQRDELYEFLANGGAHREGVAKVHGWTKVKAPSAQALSAWLVGETRRRRHLAAKETMLVSMANCPADMDAQTRQALGLAKYLASLEDLAPRDVVALLKADHDEQRLELDKLRLSLDARLAKRDLRIERDRLIFERIKGGEKSQDLQQQIDLALDEIEKMKHGEDAA